MPCAVRKSLLTSCGSNDAMRYAVALFLTVSVMACDTPGPEFAGTDPVRISVGPSTFDVRVKDKQAQAIRLNAEWAPRREVVAPRAVLAIERVSGCRVRRLDGDQVVIGAALDCGERRDPLPRDKRYQCGIVAISEGRSEAICDPVD